MGLGRMKLVDLGVEAARRGLATVSDTGKCLTREELIRLIKAHVVENATTSVETTRNPAMSATSATSSTTSSMLMTPRAQTVAGSQRPSSEPHASSQAAPRPLQVRRGVRRADSRTSDVGGDFTMLEEDNDM